MFSLTRRQVFLLDGFGGIVTATLLGLVLPYFQEFIGMPQNVLIRLAMLGMIYAAYSLTCAFRIQCYKPVWLMTIIVANLAYCVYTAVLMIIYSSELLPWGFAYFIAEILVIICLVFIEYQVFKTS